MAIFSFLAGRHTSRYRHFIKAAGTPGFIQDNISYKHTQTVFIFQLKIFLNYKKVIVSKLNFILNDNTTSDDPHVLDFVRSAVSRL